MTIWLMAVSRAVTLTDGPTVRTIKEGVIGLKVARTYCACMAGPLHWVHMAGSLGQQCSPESRQQIFLPLFYFSLVLPVLLLSMYRLLSIWCIESLPFTTVLFNFVSDVWSCWPIHRTKIIADQTQLFINHSWTIAKDSYVKHTVNDLWCYQPV